MPAANPEKAEKNALFRSGRCVCRGNSTKGLRPSARLVHVVARPRSSRRRTTTCTETRDYGSVSKGGRGVFVPGPARQGGVHEQPGNGDRPKRTRNTSRKQQRLARPQRLELRHKYHDRARGHSREVFVTRSAKPVAARTEQSPRSIRTRLFPSLAAPSPSPCRLETWPAVRRPFWVGGAAAGSLRSRPVAWV